MNPYRDTQETWNRLAAAYRDRFMDLDLYDATYAQFCAGLRPGAQVLDAGCGPGNVSRRLLGMRPDLQITGIDAAPAMVDLARELVPEAQFQVMDLRDLGQLSPASWDGIFCGFTLPYLNGADCAAFFMNAHALLRPHTGILACSCIEGVSGSVRTDVSSDGQHAMQVFLHSEADVHAWIEGAGLRPADTFRHAWTRRDGSTEVHLTLLCTWG